MEVQIWKDDAGILVFTVGDGDMPELEYVGKTFLTLFAANGDELPLLSPGQSELHA